MADTKYESKNKVESNFIEDFFTGGNGKNVGYTNDLYDLQQFVKEGEVGLQQQAGLISADEAADILEGFTTENEKNRKEAVDQVNFQSGVNATLNTVGLGLSFTGVGALGKAGGVAKGATQGLMSVSDDALKIGTKAVSKHAIKQAGKEALKNASDDIIKEAGEKAIREAGKTAAKEAAEASGKTLGRNALRNAGKKALQNASDDMIREAGEKAIRETAEQAALNSGKYTLKTVGDDVLRTSKNISNQTVLAKGQKLVLDGSGLTFKVTGSNGLRASFTGTVANSAKNVASSFKGTTGLLSGVKNTAKAVVRTGKAVGTVQGALAQRIGSAASGLASHFTKPGISAFIGKTASLGVATAPLITTQMITRSISEEKTRELTDSITTLQNASDYYTNCRESLTREQQEVFEAMDARRDEDHTELLETYAEYIDENGNFTNAEKEAEFQESYIALENKYAEELKEQQKDWAGFADYSTHEGVSNDMSTHMIQNSIDPMDVYKNSEYVADKAADPRNKEAFEKAEKASDIRKDLNDEGFLGFLDSIHDTIIHYVPVLAYAEAFVKKGADLLFEGLERIMPTAFHEEKYAGVGIGELANMIVDDVNADHEKRLQIQEYARDTENRATDSYDQYQAMKEKEQAEAESGQQSGQVAEGPEIAT